MTCAEKGPAAELEAEAEDVSLEKLRELMSFGRYGFKGTLWSGVCGMVLIVILAALDGFTELDLGAVGILGIGVLVLAGVVSFGYFSLRRLPAIDVQITPEGEIRLTAKRSG